MNHDYTLECIKQQFIQYPDKNRPDNQLLQLIAILLKCNDFEFNNKLYLQTCGCPMGQTIGPSAANIYLLKFDQLLHTHPTLKTLLFYRYLDDIFNIMDITPDDVLTFQSYLNTLLPGIKVTLEFSSTNIHFLDINIYKYFDTQDNCYRLHTNTYFKPTDTHQLLWHDSFHPKHTITGILKSQFIRFKRLSSTYTDYINTCKILTHSLKNRGYSESFMRKLYNKTWFNENTTKNTCINSTLLPIILPFNKFSNNLAITYKKILFEDPICKTFRLTNAFHNHKNLSQILIRNRVP